MQQVSVCASSPVPSYSSFLTQQMPQPSHSDYHSCLVIRASVLRFQNGRRDLASAWAAARRARRTNDLAAIKGL